MCEDNEWDEKKKKKKKEEEEEEEEKDKYLWCVLYRGRSHYPLLIGLSGAVCVWLQRLCPTPRRRLLHVLLSGKTMLIMTLRRGQQQPGPRIRSRSYH